ncbi:aspartate/glutamate racemase family protein [Chloroflexota bacterium]
MKKIGIVGGLGPESTLYYYRMLIDLSRDNSDFMGNLPEIIIYSMNQADVLRLRGSGNKSELIAKQVAAIESLYRAGADFGLISCNACHVVFDEIQVESPMPLISIVNETCKEVVKHKISKVGLFGILGTMKAHFYQDKFKEHNISVVVPREKEQVYLHTKLRSELSLGIISNDTREGYFQIVKRMVVEESIQGLILGCTEMPLLLKKVDEEKAGIPFFDTSRIHVQSALRYYWSGT